MATSAQGVESAGVVSHEPAVPASLTKRSAQMHSPEERAIGSGKPLQTREGEVVRSTGPEKQRNRAAEWPTATTSTDWARRSALGAF